MSPMTINPDNFPKRTLMAVGLMLLVILVSVTVVRVAHLHTDVTVAQPTIVERSLRFEDRIDGSIAVIDAQSLAEIAQIAPGSNGFLRSTVRGLVRERKRRELGPEMPFVLAIRTDGRLTLDDPATSRHVDLDAFGSVNAIVFRHFLPGVHIAASTAASPGVTVVNR